MKRINSMVWGTVLLLAGIVLTLGQVGVLDISSDLIVPIILLALSVIFHLYFFLSSENNEGLLVPGGILLTYGLLFLSVASFNGTFALLWPLFILGPALGLFELYVFSRGRKGSMIPVFILTAVGGAFLLRNFQVADFGVIMAIVLIGIGVALMVSALFKSGRKEYGHSHVEIKVDAKSKEAPRDEYTTEAREEPRKEPKPEPPVEPQEETIKEPTPKEENGGQPIQ